MEFLTTSEAADYVRLGERKLYELVTSGAIPCSKVAGKWLFPRHELDLWVLSGLARPAGMIAADPPPIVGGSQDDLLEWTLRESGSGLASLTEGTARGVERLQRGEVIAAAVHFHSDAIASDAADEANIATVRAMPGLHDAVLVAFVRREQGLLVAPGNPKHLHRPGRCPCHRRANGRPAARRWRADAARRAADARRRRTTRICGGSIRHVSRVPILPPPSAPARRIAASRPAPRRNRRASISSRCCGKILIC